MDRRSNRKRGNGKVQEANIVNEINKLTKAMKAKESYILYDVLFIYYLLMTLLLAMFPVFTGSFSLWNTLKICFNVAIWFTFAYSISVGSIFFIIYILCGINIILIGEYNKIIVAMIIINFFVSIVKDISLYLISKYCIT